MNQPTDDRAIQKFGFLREFYWTETGERILAEDALLAIARGLGAASFGGPLSAAEQAMLALGTPSVDRPSLPLEQVGEAILSGHDPLGDALCNLRSAEVRRHAGAIYTPRSLVRPMVDWTLSERPRRVVDAGAGSGRFLAEIARRDPNLELVAIDRDPMATLITRASLSVLGAKNLSVVQGDYTQIALETCDGRTAFIGNPPYIRHHQIQAEQKLWAREMAQTLGLTVSGLAGLHAYFFLATAVLSRQDDIGCFVTSAEWLDVNYGSIIRELLLGKLGGASITVVEPTARPFENALTTAAVTCFRVGEKPRFISLRPVKRLQDMRTLNAGHPVTAERLAEATRWTPLIRTTKKPPAGYVELGELCRVHRGAVTGLNAVWVTRGNPHGLPMSVLYPSITRARELFDAGSSLASADGLSDVIDLPEMLDEFNSEDLRKIEAFLKQAKQAGAADGYVARNRKTWWSVGLRSPAPILATYMARRPPTFVRNLVDARHINIAHGLYPRDPLPNRALDRLADELRTSVTVAQGRTYAGGLTKFEPREMERLLVPDLPVLLAQ